jgi:hypothetical protein
MSERSFEYAPTFEYFLCVQKLSHVVKISDLDFDPKYVVALAPCMCMTTTCNLRLMYVSRVTRWFIFKPNIPIEVNFGRP